MTFSIADPLLLDDQLTGSEKRYRTRAAAFASEVLSPRVVDDYRNETTDRSIVAAYGAAGLLGLMLPSSAGGQDSSFTTFGLVCRELERVDSGYRTTLMAQEALVIFPLHAFGSDSHRQRYLPELIAGTSIGAFGFTETNAGSDPAGIETRAEKAPGGYRLNGTKIWVTNAPLADLFVIWARSEAHGGELRAFVLERDTPGLSTQASAGKLSLRASPTGDVLMDDVWVDDSAILPDAKGVRAALECLNRARCGTAWGALGAAEDCFVQASSHGMARRQFGQQLAAQQLFQKKLADMLGEIALAGSASLQVTRLMDDGRARPEHICLIKRNNCRKAIEIARAARDMLGASGILDSASVMRHTLNLESTITYEGTDDVQALIIGRAITGLAAFER